MRMTYRGPVAAVTLRGPDGKGTTYHLTPGAEVDLPDVRYTRSLQARGLLEPIAQPAAAAAPRAKAAAPAAQLATLPTVLAPASADDKSAEKAAEKPADKKADKKTEPSR